MDKPLVSISCITFNHAPYIRQCLEGFMMQETDFPFEVLIHDDASTDGTKEIIEEFVDKYPDIIFPLFQTENQYSKGVRGINVEYNYPRARGKYIAVCEGDDFWTDPLKLQKQIDFLESNPNCSLCVGGFISRYSNSLIEREVVKRIKENDKPEGYYFTLEDTERSWLTKTLTAVFRNDTRLYEGIRKYKYGRDINLFYHILKFGSGFYFTECFGVYNIHEGGVNSMKVGIVNQTAAYNVYKELYLVNEDEFSRHMYLKHTMALFNFNIYSSKRVLSSENFKLFSEALLLVHYVRDIKILVKYLLPISRERKS